MGYRISLTTSAANSLSSEGSLRKDILLELKQLGDEPRRARKVVYGPYEGWMMHSFRVSRPPATGRFAVLLQFSQDEEELVVITLKRWARDEVPFG